MAIDLLAELLRPLLPLYNVLSGQFVSFHYPTHIGTDSKKMDLRNRLQGNRFQYLLCGETALSFLAHLSDQGTF